VPLVEHLNRHAVHALGDELHAQSASAISQSQVLGEAVSRVQHVPSVDGVQSGHVGQVWNEQLEHLQRQSSST